MADPAQIQFGIHSYRSDTRQLSSERCLNFYAEKHTARSKSPVVLRGAPGIVPLATCGTGPVRGLWEWGDVLYVVSGRHLYSVSETGVPTVLGGEISGNGLVSMDDNRVQIEIVNGQFGYIYDTLGGFRLITSPDFHASSSITNMGGIFVLARDGTADFYISDTLDGETYSDLFAAEDSKSDPILAVYNHLELLHVFGTRSTGFWQNVGAPNFPFRRMPGGVLGTGIAGVRAFTMEDNTIYSLGSDRIPYKYTGAKVEKISTPPIDEHFQSFATVSDCEMFGYTFEGHKFVVYNFPSANETWVWDIASSLWHERESRRAGGVNLGRWRANCSAQAYGKTIVGDKYSGQVGYLDRSVYTEFDEQIVGEVVCPPIHAGGRYITMPWLEIMLETGVGLSSGLGHDPQIMLSVSDDGGRSYSGPEMWASMGQIGDHKLQSVRFGPLGGFYERTMKLTISDPVRRSIMSAYAHDMEVGS
jgi:hypothetical protein